MIETDVNPFTVVLVSTDGRTGTLTQKEHHVESAPDAVAALGQAVYAEVEMLPLLHYTITNQTTGASVSRGCLNPT